MKLITICLAALAICPVAMGSVPTSTDTEKSENFTNLTQMLDQHWDFVAGHGLVADGRCEADWFAKTEVRFLPVLQNEGAQSAQTPPKPTDFLYSWSGPNRYAVASTVVLPDFKGWKGVNGVAVGGYRLDPNGDVPVFGAGLEYPRQFTISGTFRLVVTVGFDYLFEQGQSLSQGQGRFRLSGGVRF
jgi:hypothetical protein